ncbi:hypothetical protein NQ176_g3471 [Zarea fungicola]|uniref:Uncharacterized protein n=1 Tax=Zarea fungicola TaxID=93591 RepID=A0ACC1NJI2_9HYPO|nr:hypothetical protein NQ176_g3471 [Lecanicillium fungicola]
MHFSLLAITVAANGAFAAATAGLSPAQALALLDGLTSHLNSVGDARVALVKATPAVNAQNIIPVYDNLNAAFTELLHVFPQGSGDLEFSSFSDAQKHALCSALPRISKAGAYATEGLLSLPSFHDDVAAYKAEVDLGLTLDPLSWAFNMLAWSLYKADADSECSKDSFNDLESINHALSDLSVKLIY